MNAIMRFQRDEPEEHAPHVLVIGGDSFGLAVAECLTEGATVTLVSDRAPPSDDSGVEFLRRRVADGSHVRSLAEELPDIDVVVAVGPDEEVLLIGYLARREFDACLVVAGITDPRTESAFEDTGVDTISLPQLLADGIRERYRYAA